MTRLPAVLAFVLMLVSGVGCGSAGVVEEGGEESASDEAALSNQSCGEMHGTYCASFQCPQGYASLGRSYDCGACCVPAAPDPSCGELGGNLCCQDASCVNANHGWFSLLNGGKPTRDCRYCIRK